MFCFVGHNSYIELEYFVYIIGDVSCGEIVWDMTVNATQYIYRHLEDYTMSKSVPMRIIWKTVFILIYSCC